MVNLKKWCLHLCKEQRQVTRAWFYITFCLQVQTWLTLQVLVPMQAFLKEPVGNDAQVLLAKMYAETKDAMASSAHWFVRVSLELQLGAVKDAQRTVTLFGQHLVDFPAPCWLLHFRTLLHWSTGELDQVPPQCSQSGLAAAWCCALSGTL